MGSGSIKSQNHTTCRFQLPAQCPVPDHRFDGLNYLANLLTTKESIPGNDLSINNPHALQV